MGREEESCQFIKEKLSGAKLLINGEGRVVFDFVIINEKSRKRGALWRRCFCEFLVDDDKVEDGTTLSTDEKSLKSNNSLI